MIAAEERKIRLEKDNENKSGQSVQDSILMGALVGTGIALIICSIPSVLAIIYIRKRRLSKEVDKSGYGGEHGAAPEDWQQFADLKRAASKRNRQERERDAER